MSINQDVEDEGSCHHRTIYVEATAVQKVGHGAEDEDGAHAEDGGDGGLGEGVAGGRKSRENDSADNSQRDDYKHCNALLLPLGAESDATEAGSGDEALAEYYEEDRCYHETAIPFAVDKSIDAYRQHKHAYVDIPESVLEVDRPGLLLDLLEVCINFHVILQ